MKLRLPHHLQTAILTAIASVSFTTLSSGTLAAAFFLGSQTLADDSTEAPAEEADATIDIGDTNLDAQAAIDEEEGRGEAKEPGSTPINQAGFNGRRGSSDDADRILTVAEDGTDTGAIATGNVGAAVQADSGAAAALPSDDQGFTATPYATGTASSSSGEVFQVTAAPAAQAAQPVQAATQETGTTPTACTANSTLGAGAVNLGSFGGGGGGYSLSAPAMPRAAVVTVPEAFDATAPAAEAAKTDSGSADSSPADELGSTTPSLSVGGASLVRASYSAPAPAMLGSTTTQNTSTTTSTLNIDTTGGGISTPSYAYLAAPARAAAPMLGAAGNASSIVFTQDSSGTGGTVTAGEWSKYYASTFTRTDETAVSAADVAATLILGGRLTVKGNGNGVNLNAYGGDIVVGNGGQLFLQTWGGSVISLDNNILIGASTWHEGNGTIRFGNDGGHTTTLNGNIYLIEDSSFYASTDTNDSNAIYIKGKVTDLVPPETGEDVRTHSTLTIKQGKLYHFQGGMDLDTLKVDNGVVLDISDTADLTNMHITGGYVTMGGNDKKHTVDNLRLSMYGKNASSVAVDADTTLHITGTEIANSGGTGSFLLSHWDSSNTVYVFGKLISEAVISSWDGTADINVENGGTLELRKGLNRNSGRTNAINVNVKDGATLVAGTADGGVNADSVHVNLNGGSTLKGYYGEGTSAEIVKDLSLGSGTVTMDVDAGKNLQLNGNISGAGSINKAGSGTLTLSGTDSAYSGNVSVNAGTLALMGTLTTTGSLTFAENTTLDLGGYRGTLSTTPTTVASATGGITGFDEGMYIAPDAPKGMEAAVTLNNNEIQVSYTAKQDATMHLYILTGQSNSLGAVKGTPLPGGMLEAYQSNALLWNGNMHKERPSGANTNRYIQNPDWQVVAPQEPGKTMDAGAYSNNPCMGAEYGFSYIMENKGWTTLLGANDTLAVVKSSLDGGGNGYWLQDNNAYKTLLDSVKLSIQDAVALGYTRISLDGFMFLQGESNSGTEAGLAASRFTGLLGYLKTDLQSWLTEQSLTGITLSFDTNSVTGEPATWTANNIEDPTSAGSVTIEQLRGLALKDGMVNADRNGYGFVYTRDLAKITSGDSSNVHYRGTAQLTIGARYAYAFAVQNGVDVGAVRGQDDSATLDTGAAWWMETAPTENDIAVWDISSVSQSIPIPECNKVADGQTLTVGGIRIEDVYNPNATEPGYGSVGITGGTIQIGKAGLQGSGITLEGADLSISSAVNAVADQTWSAQNGHKLAVNGTTTISEGATLTFADNLYLTFGAITGTGNLAIGKVTFDMDLDYMLANGMGEYISSAGAGDNGFFTGNLNLVKLTGESSQITFTGDGGSIANITKAGELASHNLELSSDKKALQLTGLQPESTVYYARRGEVTYTSTDTGENGIYNAAQVALAGSATNPAILTLSSALKDGVTIKSEGLGGTINIVDGVTLAATSADAAGAPVIITGEGEFVGKNVGNAGSFSAAAVFGDGVSLSNDWKGAVVLSGGNASFSGYTSMNALGDYHKADSTIVFNGLYAYFDNNYTVAADIEFRGTGADGTGTAFTMTAGNQKTVNFTGAITGKGDFVYDKNGGSAETFNFSGDVSNWTGSITTGNHNSGALNLIFSGSVTNVSASVVRGSNHPINVTVNANNPVVFKAAVTGLDSLTVNANKSATFESGLTTASTTLNAGSTLSVTGSGETYNLGAVNTGTGTLDLMTSVSTGNMTVATGSTLVLAGEEMLTVGGTLTLQAGSTLVLARIFAAQEAPVQDNLLQSTQNSNGPLSIGGNLGDSGLLSGGLLGAAAPAAGDYILATANNISLADNVNLSNIAEGYTGTLSINEVTDGKQLILTLAASVNDLIWDNNAQNSNWDVETSNNWHASGTDTPGTSTFAANDNVTFANGVTNSPVLQSDITAGTVTIESGATATINGNGHNFTAGAVAGTGAKLVLANNSGTYTVNGDAQLHDLDIGTGTTVFAGGTGSLGTIRMTGNSATTLRFSKKDGAANSYEFDTLAMSYDNSSSGGPKWLVVDKGVTVSGKETGLGEGNNATINNSWGIGSGGLEVNGTLTTKGIINMDSGSNQSTIKGSGQINTAGLNISNNNTTTIQGGIKVNITSGTGIKSRTGNGTLNLADATLQAKDVDWTLSRSANLTDATTGTTFETSAGRTITVSGSLSGNGKLVKTGTGTLELTTAPNNYTGQVTIDEGILLLTTNTLPGTLTVANDSAGELHMRSSQGTTSQNVELKNISSPNLHLVADANHNSRFNYTGNSNLTGVQHLYFDGAQVWLNGQDLSYTGAVTFNATTYSEGTGNLNNAALRASNNATFSGTVEIKDTARLTIFDGKTVEFSGTVTGSGNIELKEWSGNSATFKVSGDASNYQGALTSDSGVRLNVAAGTGKLSLAGGSNVAGAVTLDGSITMNGGTNSTISGTISGSGSLTKDGAGTLTLSGNNSNYSGSTTINAGTLVASSANALGSGAVTLSSGTLDLTSSVDTGAFSLNGGTLKFADADSLDVTGIFNIGGSSVLDLSRITVSGPSNVTLASTTAGVTGNIGDITLQGLTPLTGYDAELQTIGNDLVLTFISQYDGLIWNGPNGNWSNATDADMNWHTAADPGTSVAFTTNQNVRFDSNADGHTVTLTENITAGTMTIDNGVSVTMSGGSNTLAVAAIDGAEASLALNGGTVSVAQNSTVGSLSGSAALQIAENATLTVGDASNSTYSGVISGAGAIEKSGAGTLTFSGANTYSGGTAVNTGTLVAAVDHSLGNGTVTVGENGMLELKADTGMPTIAGTGTVKITDGDFQYHSATFLEGFTGKVLIADGGLVQIGNQSSKFAGAATLEIGSGGTIKGWQANFSKDILLSGGTLSDANDWEKYTGNITLAQGTSSNVAPTPNHTITLSGTISGSGSLNKTDTGTAEISGNNTYTGGTTVSAGKLKATNANALGTGTVTVNSGATLEYTSAANINSLVNNGTVNLNGGGSNQTLANIGTISGAGNISISSTNGNRTYNLTGDISQWTGTLSQTSGSGNMNLNISGTSALNGNIENTATGGACNITVNLKDDMAVNGSINYTSNGPVIVNVGDAGTAVDATFSNSVKVSTLNVANADSSAIFGAGSTLTATGAVTIGGTLDLGAMANTATTGALTLNGGSMLKLSGEGQDLLHVASFSANPTTTLDLSALNIGEETTTYTLLTSSAGIDSSMLGNMTVAGLDLPQGMEYELGISGNSLVLTFSHVSTNLVWNGGDGDWHATKAWHDAENETRLLDFSDGVNVTFKTGDPMDEDTVSLGSDVTVGTLTVVAPVDGMAGVNIVASEDAAPVISAQGVVVNANAAAEIGVQLDADTVTVNEGGYLALNLAGSAELDAAVSGGGTLAKAGSGTLILTGNNADFSGTLYVNSGTLAVASATAMGNADVAVLQDAVLELTTSASASSLTLNSGSTLKFDGTSALTLGNMEIKDGVFFDFADFSFSDSGTATLATWSGSFTGDTDYITLNNLGPRVSNAELTLSGNSLELTYTYNPPRDLVWQGGPGEWNTATANEPWYHKTEQETWELVAFDEGDSVSFSVQTYSPVSLTEDITAGDVTIDKGVEVSLSNGTAGKVDLNADDIVVNGDLTVTNVGVNADEMIINEGGHVTAAVTVEGYTGTMETNVSGSGDVTKTGEGNLNILGDNGNFTGTITIEQGKVIAGTSTALGNAPNVVLADNGVELAGNIAPSGDIDITATATDGTVSANMQVANDATLTFNTTGNTTITETGVISGAGDIVKDGTGTLVLDADNTYSGTLNINNGTVLVSNTGALGGDNTQTVMVNQGGTLAFDSAESGRYTADYIGLDHGATLTFAGTNKLEVDKLYLTANSAVDLSNIEVTGYRNYVLAMVDEIEGSEPDIYNPSKETRLGRDLVQFVSMKNLTPTGGFTMAPDALISLHYRDGQLILEVNSATPGFYWKPSETTGVTTWNTTDLNWSENSDLTGSVNFVNRQTQDTNYAYSAYFLNAGNDGQEVIDITDLEFTTKQSGKSRGAQLHDFIIANGDYTFENKEGGAAQFYVTNDANQLSNFVVRGGAEAHFKAVSVDGGQNTVTHICKDALATMEDIYSWSTYSINNEGEFDVEFNAGIAYMVEGMLAHLDNTGVMRITTENLALVQEFVDWSKFDIGEVMNREGATLVLSSPHITPNFTYGDQIIHNEGLLQFGDTEESGRVANELSVQGNGSLETVGQNMTIELRNKVQQNTMELGADDTQLSGEVTITDTTTVKAGATATFSGGGSLGDVTLESAENDQVATMVFTGAKNYAADTVTAGAGSVFDVQNDATVTIASYNAGGTPEGSIVVGDGTGETPAHLVVNGEMNAATLNVQGGTADLNGYTTVSTLTQSGGTANFNAGGYVGGGTVSGGTLDICDGKVLTLGHTITETGNYTVAPTTGSINADALTLEENMDNAHYLEAVSGVKTDSHSGFLEGGQQFVKVFDIQSGTLTGNNVTVTHKDAAGPLTLQTTGTYAGYGYLDTTTPAYATYYVRDNYVTGAPSGREADYVKLSNVIEASKGGGQTAQLESVVFDKTDYNKDAAVQGSITVDVQGQHANLFHVAEGAVGVVNIADGVLLCCCEDYAGVDGQMEIAGKGIYQIENRGDLGANVSLLDGETAGIEPWTGTVKLIGSAEEVSTTPLSAGSGDSASTIEFDQWTGSFLDTLDAPMVSNAKILLTGTGVQGDSAIILTEGAANLQWTNTVSGEQARIDHSQDGDFTLAMTGDTSGWNGTFNQSAADTTVTLGFLDETADGVQNANVLASAGTVDVTYGGNLETVNGSAVVYGTGDINLAYTGKENMQVNGTIMKYLNQGSLDITVGDGTEAASASFNGTFSGTEGVTMTVKTGSAATINTDAELLRVLGDAGSNMVVNSGKTLSLASADPETGYSRFYGVDNQGAIEMKAAGGDIKLVDTADHTAAFNLGNVVLTDPVGTAAIETSGVAGKTTQVNITQLNGPNSDAQVLKLTNGNATGTVNYNLGGDTVFNGAIEFGSDGDTGDANVVLGSNGVAANTVLKSTGNSSGTADVVVNTANAQVLGIDSTGSVDGTLYGAESQKKITITGDGAYSYNGNLGENLDIAYTGSGKQTFEGGAADFSGKVTVDNGSAQAGVLELLNATSVNITDLTIGANDTLDLNDGTNVGTAVVSGTMKAGGTSDAPSKLDGSLTMGSGSTYDVSAAGGTGGLNLTGALTITQGALLSAGDMDVVWAMEKDTMYDLAFGVTDMTSFGGGIDWSAGVDASTVFNNGMKEGEFYIRYSGAGTGGNGSNVGAVYLFRVAVPEPTTSTLSLLALAALAARRRRK